MGIELRPRKRPWNDSSNVAETQKIKRIEKSYETIDKSITFEKILDETIVKSNSECKITEKSKSLDNRVCKIWAEGKRCIRAARCPRLHKWFSGEGLSMLAKLQGHTEAITGIVIPQKSNQLFSAGKDATLRVWDCHTGRCTKVYNLPAEVGSLLNEGPWIFVGLPNLVKAWNIQAHAEFNLAGPVGQVHAMAEENELLFAGAEDGAISVWKYNQGSNDALAILKGHNGAVACLVVGAMRLYSGSVDHTIRVWTVDTLQCLMTLNEHFDTVMSLICWDQFLISCSLDRTVNVWACTEEGSLEVHYSRTEDDGLLAFSGMYAESKPILLCSCIDNSVRLYDLPTFAERGRLFARKEVRTLEVGPQGLFFSGDATGLLTVWKLTDAGCKVAESS